MIRLPISALQMTTDKDDRDLSFLLQKSTSRTSNRTCLQEEGHAAGMSALQGCQPPYRSLQASC